MSRVKYKYRTESVKLGNVRTIFKWDGVRKMPSVSYVHEDQVIPEEGSLDTVINSFDDTSTPVEETNVLISSPTPRANLLLG